MKTLTPIDSVLVEEKELLVGQQDSFGRQFGSFLQN
jgi:hypothetical protein